MTPWCADTRTGLVDPEPLQWTEYLVGGNEARCEIESVDRQHPRRTCGFVNCTCFVPPARHLAGGKPESAARSGGAGSRGSGG